MPFARPPKSRKPPAPLDIEGLLAYSARVLTARAQTTSELRQKLTRRAAQRGDVDEVIRRLKENGYLNDQRFAESFANWRRDNDGIGKTKVVRDLMARRVAPDLAKKTAEAVYSGTDETALIERFLARKFRGRDLGALLQEEKHLASAFRRLRTAGFSAGSSIQVLKRYAAEAGRLEEIGEDEPPE
jgi:regulatory protein